MNTRQPSSPFVIVIGGGFAGIAAARALHDASFKVTEMEGVSAWLGQEYNIWDVNYGEGLVKVSIGLEFSGRPSLESIEYFGHVILLESRERIGGRVCTDYSFGFPVDLGASWLHGVCKENPLVPLIERLGLPLYRTSTGENSVLFDHDLESYALFDMDGNQVPHELVSKVGVTFESIIEETNKLREEFSEDMSIQHAISIAFERNPKLRLEGLPRKVLQWYLSDMELWFAAEADNISLKCWDKVEFFGIPTIPHNRFSCLIALEEMLPGGHGYMVQGYQPVINTLAKDLDIRLGHRVNRIKRSTDHVMVTVENGQTFVADAAIVTVPVGVLKSKAISFEPRLPEWKEEAISNIGIGIENRIVLHFERVFWPNVEFLGVVAETSYECSYFLNLHKAVGHAVLVYMPAGNLAKDIEKMSDEAAAKFAFLHLKKIFPGASKPIRYLVSGWGSDVNSLGSYSYDKVGNPHDLCDKLRMSVGNLFFAGDATSADYPSLVHGAYSSGLMAAHDCRKHYGELDVCPPILDVDNLAPGPLLISRCHDP